MVKVCDAIMGSGKTSSAINYINAHPEKRIIYVTPYVEESVRIQRGCHRINYLYVPQKKDEFNGSKILHTMDLVSQGKSVSTTHAAFKSYPPELLDKIKELGYTLIIDEDVDVLEEEKKFTSDDIQLAVDAGYIKDVGNGEYEMCEDKYVTGALRELFRMLKTRNIVRMTEKDIRKNKVYFWKYPADLLTAFEDVIIMTYLFEGCSLCHFLNLNDIPYEYIYIKRDENGEYSFSDEPSYVPEYTKHIKEKIHIERNPKMNEVGNRKNALSGNWLKTHPEEVAKLKNNVYNFFFHKSPRGTENKLWSTFEDAKSKLIGMGYTKAYIAFNQRATNKHRAATHLAYCVNIYMNVSVKRYYEGYGIDINEDAFALSTMTQWVWRSAIRDGKDIWLYLPSKRMRDLLEGWMDSLGSDGDADE